jgi:negative regulator of flagellin synthesis FlgM
MQISGNFSVSGIDAARAATRSDNTPAPQSTTEAPQSAIVTPTDQLELSPEALSINSTQASGEVFRADKVAGLREAIAQGNYDTDEKLSAALGKLIDQIG